MNDKEENSQLPEGWHPDMKPMPQQLAEVPVLTVDDSSGEPVVEKVEQVDEGAEYWRKKFEEVKLQNENNAPFVGILDHLKTNPNLVDVLEKHVAGEFVEARKQTIFDGGEEDAYGNPIEAEDPEDKPELTTEQRGDIEKRARAEGEMAAKAKIELRQFLSNLMQTGVPDHLADKFVNTLNNPTGFNLADLYAAFENKEARDGENAEGSAPKGKGQTPMGVPVSTAGGSTDKPTGDAYLETQEGDGSNYRSNPNQPF